MNSNPEQLKPGDIVILDREYRNKSEVKIIALSEPTGMFATVQSTEFPDDPCYQWDVMTRRLTRKQ